MSSLRSDLPALKNKIYFNYGGQGPLPASSLKAITTSWGKIQELGPFTNDVWPYIANEIQKTKTEVSRLCGVTNNRVALTENVTSGCVLPLWGLPLHEGDSILISNCEHPGVVAACKELSRRKGVTLEIFDVKSLKEEANTINSPTSLVIKTLENHLKDSTKLVVLSHLIWNTGEIMPIELIVDVLSTCKSQPFLLVDAAQSFGQIPIKQAASKADIYAFTGHKWAFGPEGLGGVVLSNRVLDEAKPTLIGWKSLIHEGSIYNNNSEPFHRDGRRFEIATSCTPLLAGLRNSIHLLEKEGNELERIKKIKNLSKRLWLELNDIDGITTILKYPPPAGLVSFSVNSSISPSHIVKTLGQQSFWIRVLEDPIWLRACVHVTSTDEEIKKLAKALREIISNADS